MFRQVGGHSSKHFAEKVLYNSVFYFNSSGFEKRTQEVEKRLAFSHSTQLQLNNFGSLPILQVCLLLKTLFALLYFFAGVLVF